MTKLGDSMQMKEICGNCGITFGSHHGGTSPWPRDYCPGHERRMDWENGPGTVFKSTGKMKTEDGEIIYLDSTFADIYNMSHAGMAWMTRYTPSGHEYFDKTKPYWEVFKARFKELGGFTPGISKEIE